MVERGLGDGAAGLSTGLEYAPGSHAAVAELAALCAPVAAAGLPYVTHMRGYEASAARGMAEVVEIARRSGAAAHVSHYHGPAGPLRALVDDALRAAMPTSPSTATLRAGLHHARDGHLAGVAPGRRLRRGPRRAHRSGHGYAGSTTNGPRRGELWDRITLSHVPADELRWAEGMRLAEAARRAGLDPAVFCREILVATRLEAGCVFGIPPSGPETADPEADADQSMRALLRHPAHMAGSDGIYRGGHPHPRGWGAFARLLGRHVRELGDWTWEQAAVAHGGAYGTPVRAAVTAGWSAAGRPPTSSSWIRRPSATRATYASPRELAVGVEHVFVNGIQVLSGGALMPGGRGAGRVVRPA